MAEKRTKTAWRPTTEMKPKPFSALNHFTVPCATCAPTFRACGRPLWFGGPGYSLFRPPNTNVELEPRENVPHAERSGRHSATGNTGPDDGPDLEAPGGSGDQAGCPHRLQRRLH